MPLASTHILHAWIKYYIYPDRMPTEPDKHYLLAFPDVVAEDHPKRYIRRLWLVALNYDRMYPQFLDPIVSDLATHVNKATLFSRKKY
jgi:hypothetical protein